MVFSLQNRVELGAGATRTYQNHTPKQNKDVSFNISTHQIIDVESYDIEYSSKVAMNVS